MGARSSDRGGRRRWWRGVGLALALALGLLLWARLKLVTNTPRMVYADPKPSAVSAETAPGGASGVGPARGGPGAAR